MDFLRHIKIGQKLTISFVTLIAITLIMAIVSFVSISEIEEADAENRLAQDLRKTYLEYEGGFSDQRQSILFYLLTGDRSSLQQYNDLSPKISASFDRLTELAQGNDELSALVADLGTHYQSWTDQYASEQIRLMRNYLTVNQARAIEVTGEPQAVIAKFDETASALASALETISQNASEHQINALARFEWTIIISIAALIIAALSLGFIMTRAIASPIGRITTVMSDLAGGQLDTEISGADRRDEIGGMAKAVEVFKNNAVEQRRLQAEEARKQEEERERHAKLESLTSNFDAQMNQGLQVVSQSMTQVATSSETMAGNATETGSLSQNASAAIEEASANIQTVSSATTELTSSIDEISRQMNETARVSSEAVEQIEQTNSRVSALNEAAASIGQVVQIISDIAEQTNLLALNATIESARAGDAGKGFAVVANEVKSLANQTGQATEDIRRQIQEIQGETEAAASSVLGIGDTIRKINELTATVASAVEEQGAATNEIARNVNEAATGTNEVSSVVQEVAIAANDTGQLAAAQKSVVDELNENNEKLKADISTFLSSVSAL